MDLLEQVSSQICGLAPELQAIIIKDIMASVYKTSLYKTCKQLLGYKEMTPRTHKEICECLEAETKRKLIVLPRGSFKSSIGVVGYSIWLLMSDPNLRILIDSEVYSNSKNFLREIKAHLANEELVQLFGSFATDHTWNESEITIAQRTKNLKEASITCGGIGTVKVGQHYDVIICDDMNSNNNSQTEEGRQKVIDHYRLSTSILEPNGILVIIGTRYSASDLIGWVINNELGDDLGEA